MKKLKPLWGGSKLGTCADYYEDFLTRTFWLGVVTRNGLGWLLTFTMPIIFGKFASEAYKVLSDSSSNLKDFSTWQPHWPVLVVLAVWIVGYLLKRFANHATLVSNELYNAITWFCEDILGTRKDKHNDIRCTVWIPIGKQGRKKPIRLIQVIHYFPKSSTLFDENGNRTGKIRINGKPFRSFRVSKRNNHDDLPIGILGQTAIDAVSGEKPTVNKEFFDTHTDFVKHMVTNWNFTKFQAKKLTPDRKSYICFPMVDKNNKELLGILYFDSCHTDAFSDKFVRITEANLPRFATIITSL